jgi:signal transduction histidine kinase/ActR/RegA family two-component response regulator
MTQSPLPRLPARLARALRRVPLSYRVGAVSTALVAVLVFNAFIALQSAQNVFAEQERLRAGVAAQHEVEMIVSHAKDLENGVRGYFIAGDPVYLEPYERARKQLPEELARLRGESGGDTAALLQQFEHAVDSFVDQSQTFALMRSQMAGVSADELRPLVERQKERMDAVRDSAAALLRGQSQATSELGQDSARARRTARISILVPSFISILLTAFLSSLVIRDLRQRQALERQREELLRQERQARAEAEAANQAKDDFVSTVSHELRTPLQAILGWTQFLMRLVRGRDSVPAAQVAAQLDTIERNARALARMIDDLLDVSRAITGKLSLATQRIDLGEIVRSSVDVSRPAAAAKRVELELELHDAPLWMVGDADRLRQVAINVVGNAIKFTPAGGRVTVRARRAGTRLELRVLDTGIGIAPELLPRIFERYVQGSVSSARQYSGLGLGLAIVKHLVEMHGGQVAVRSEGLGRGAEFVLEFPIVAVEPAQPVAAPHAASAPPPLAAAAGAAAAGDRLAGLRLLVVDDDADVRSVLDSLLGAEGARVFSAASAADALERLRGQRFDAVLSDIGMPETDGYALARRIRALRERESATPAAVPLIAFTAFSREEDARRALEGGFDAHIGKPAELEQLIEVLRRCAAPSAHLPIELRAARAGRP